MTLCSLSGVTLTCTGGIMSSRNGKFNSSKAPSALTWHPHPSPIRVLHKLRCGGKRFEPSVRRKLFVTWSGSTLLFKISEWQCGTWLGTVLLPALRQDLMLVYQSTFSHHSDSILKLYFTFKVSIYCQSKIRVLWQMKARLKSVSFPIILVSLSLAD